MKPSPDPYEIYRRHILKQSAEAIPIATSQKPFLSPSMEALESFEGHMKRLIESHAVLAANVEHLQSQQNRIAKLLATFWEAPISISSVQPLMELARELNPHLR